MPDTKEQTMYDDEMRARIRAALDSYMERYHLGAELMHNKLYDFDPLKRDIGRSTLQRFIRNSHRTNDAYVGLIVSFLESEGVELPDLDADQLENFEEALADFLLPPESDGDAVDQKLEIAGRYQPEDPNVPNTTIRITPSSEATKLRIWEEQNHGIVSYHYEGVLVARGNHLFGVLRNVLTHEPRVYWLHYGGGLMPEDDSEKLFGEVHERPFLSPVARADTSGKVSLIKRKAPSL